MMAVAKGDMLGSTVWVISCTNPPVMEATVAEVSSNPIILPATTSTLSTMSPNTNATISPNTNTAISITISITITITTKS